MPSGTEHCNPNGINLFDLLFKLLLEFIIS